MYCVRKVNEDYTWIGADSRRLAVFEGVFGVPEGVSYNSYLLLDEKTVLFDTVDAQVIRQFRENLLHTLSGRTLDYIVVHHMEPDHTAELEDLVLRFPEVQILCTAMAKTMIGQFFGHAYDDRIHVCKEGDTLCTGRHTLQFVMAPMVHWPEVMMTYDRYRQAAAVGGCLRLLRRPERATSMPTRWILTGTIWTSAAGTTPISWGNTAPRCRRCCRRRPGWRSG